MTSPWEIPHLRSNDTPCQEICRSIGSDITGEVVKLLAGVPGCLERFYTSLQPALRSHRVRSIADQLRKAGTIAAHGNVGFSDHLVKLDSAGFTREDSRQIRYLIECFYSVEPVLMMISAVALRWIQGTASSITRSIEYPAEVPTTARFAGPIVLEAVESTIPFGIYASPSHPFYKALSIWSDYVAIIREDCSASFDSAGYAEAIASVRSCADSLSVRIPISAFEDDAADKCAWLGESIEQCLNTSAEVIILACALRRMYIRAEIAARRRRLMV